MDNKIYNLSDNVISSIVQMLQLAIITGTDISDWFRMIKLAEDVGANGILQLSEDYRNTFEKQIQKLRDDAENLLNQKLDKNG